nr:unnamed protein product [Digitaria exilis]
MARAARKAAAAALLSPPLSSSSPSSAALQPRAGRDLLGRKTGVASSGTPQERARSCDLPCWVGARGFHDAGRAFDRTSTRSLPAWTAIISGCARGGRHADGMRAFAEMLGDGGAPTPNAFVLAGVLRCCAGLGDVEPGRRVHGWMLRRGVRQDVVLCNAVLDMYAKCGHHGRARRAFGAMADKDAVSWNIVLSACLQGGDVLGAARLFDESPLRDTTSWNTIISGLYAVVAGPGAAAPWSRGDVCAGG